MCQAVLMPSQHILRRACKFASDSDQEAQLTVGTLNAKLDDLSYASDKVRDGLLHSLLVNWWLSVMNGVVNSCHLWMTHTATAGVSEINPNMDDPTQFGAIDAAYRQHHHQGPDGASHFLPCAEAHECSRLSQSRICCADWCWI